MAEAPKTARQRKRDAVGNLCELAQTLGVDHDRRNPEMSMPNFETLHGQVLQQARTPEQRQAAGDA